MPYRVYKYAGRWHFKDGRGVRHSYDTERGAKIWAGRIKAFYEKSIKKLHYNAGDAFGKTVYEQMYMNDDQASEALGSSSGSCVLRWMMDDFYAGDESEFDAIEDLNNCPTSFDSIWDDGYSVREVLTRMGMKLVKMLGQWRILKDADSDYEGNFDTVFGIDA